jgi:hypothetical protein
MGCQNLFKGSSILNYYFLAGLITERGEISCTKMIDKHQLFYPAHFCYQINHQVTASATRLEVSQWFDQILHRKFQQSL